MSSRFNTLYRGEAKDAAEVLDETFSGATDLANLAAALVNALRRIATLEEQMQSAMNQLRRVP